MFEEQMFTLSTNCFSLVLCGTGGTASSHRLRLAEQMVARSDSVSLARIVVALIGVVLFLFLLAYSYQVE